MKKLLILIACLIAVGCGKSNPTSPMNGRTTESISVVNGWTDNPLGKLTIWTTIKFLADSTKSCSIDSLFITPPNSPTQEFTNFSSYESPISGGKSVSISRYLMNGDTATLHGKFRVWVCGSWDNKFHQSAVYTWNRN